MNFDEADAEWERRDQIMNKYVLMRQKRDDDVVEGVFETKKATNTGKRERGDLKIHGAEDERFVFKS